jgi:PTS system nitrogen regulatory IIA component
VYLTLQDVSTLLEVPERTIRRWVEQGDLPAREVNGAIHFNRLQLIEWATLHARELPAHSVAKLAARSPEDLPPLNAALQRGGVHSITAPDRAALLRAVAAALPLPDDFDRAGLTEVLLSRESLRATALGEGIALPHPRAPIVMPSDDPIVTLLYLQPPLDLPTPDGKPIAALFILLSPTVRLHLQMLAQLSVALRDPTFRTAVQRRTPQAELLGLLA